MFNIGGAELLVILLLALLILGPERLPKAMGQVGRYVAQLRKMSSGFQDEIKRAMDPVSAPFRPGQETLKGRRPAIEDEVRVVNASDAPTSDDIATDDGSSGPALAALEAPTDSAVPTEPDVHIDEPEAGDEAEVAPDSPPPSTAIDDDEANVTPLRPRRDDARATG